MNIKNNMNKKRKQISNKLTEQKKIQLFIFKWNPKSENKRFQSTLVFFSFLTRVFHVHLSTNSNKLRQPFN